MVSKSAFGRTERGEDVDVFTLSNSHGMVAKVMTFGATLTELHVPDRNGVVADVVLGFDDFASYQAGHPYFGVTAGRVANRIAKGKFTLDGVEYTLATNNGPNHLHGGVRGWDKAVWKAVVVETAKGRGVRFTHVSPDGDEGYPGTVTASVTYLLSESDELMLVYEATTDRATPLNMTHHSYFNLTGNPARDVLGHKLTVFAQSYTPVDATLIPTGELAPVAGTPFDFRESYEIGARIGELKNGYDHNFVLDGGRGDLHPAAVVYEPSSGRVMRVHTTDPGLQFYSGNFLDGSNIGKDGVAYHRHAGFCLEAQVFPDAINKVAFPNVVLRPGDTYRKTTVYAFLR